MNRDRNEEQMNGKQRIEEQPDELDRELAQMAQDAPDMPADFHARWTEQVRAEAGQAKTGSRQESRRQWRYALSAAAVFIFLIGGTLLTRNAGDRNIPVSAALSNSAPVKEDAAPAYGTLTAVEEESHEPLLFAMNSAVEEPSEAALEEASEAAADAVYGTGEEERKAYKNGAPAALMMTAAPATPEPEPETAEKAAGTEETVEEAYDAVPEAAFSGTAGTEAAGQPETKSGSEFVSFLKDLGIFTAKTLAAVFCCAALAFLAAAVHRALKKRKQ